MTNFLVRVTDDVVSASCGRNSEQKEAPRSTSEIRQYRVVGHRKSDRTRRVQVHLFFKIKKHLTFKLSAFNMVRVTGLEPVRHEHTPLKRACLPIPAHSHTTLTIISLIISVVNQNFKFFKIFIL